MGPQKNLLYHFIMAATSRVFPVFPPPSGADEPTLVSREEVLLIVEALRYFHRFLPASNRKLCVKLKKTQSLAEKLEPLVPPIW